MLFLDRRKKWGKGFVLISNILTPQPWSAPFYVNLRL